MPTTTHNPNISVTITLDTAPQQEAGFGTLLILVDQATNTLNGVRMMTLTDYAAAQTANTAGYISASTLAAALVAFSQRPEPEEIKLGRVNLAGAETYSQALAACIIYDPDFYGVALADRTQAVFSVLSDAVEATTTKKMLLVVQDDDVSWLDAAAPAGVSGMTSNERSIVLYHPTDADWADVGLIANRLVYDPDERSAPWHGYAVRGITTPAAPPTEAQRAFVIANYANLGLPYGGEDFVIDPGINFNNRAVDEIVTSDWFAIRLQERTAALVVAHGNRGEKIVVDKSGQAKLLAVINGLLSQGDQAGHFVAPLATDPPRAVAETITDADRSARRLRFTVRAQLAVSGRIFTFNCYFSRDPVTT